MKLMYVGLAIVVLSAPVGYLLLRQDLPDRGQVVADAFQKNTGLSGSTLLALTKVQDKMRGHKSISEDEWKLVEDASQSKALEFRVNSLEGLNDLEGTPYRDRAHEIMRRLVNDSDASTAALALTRCVESHDPQVPELIAEAEKNPSKIMQNQVVLIKKRWKM
jgi:hypothetical protein